MKAMSDMIPKEGIWSGFGIGKYQMLMAAQALVLGGNIRVGLEDNLYLSKDTFATNGQLVEKVVRIASDLGAKISNPKQTREKLKLTKHF
jgi:uncharacterized protein (DUF849 family)